MEEPLIYRLAIALGIGLIVGLERGWKTRMLHSGQRFAGIRTFSLAGLLGGVLAALAEPDRFIVLAAGSLVIGGLVIGAYWIGVRETRDLGMTTELALLTTFALGAFAVLGSPFTATAAAIVMALLLGFKTEFHNVIEKLERQEMLATLQLLAIAAVLVPLLPARDMGPWEAINPRTIGILVLLIAGMSYLGYFAVRMLGPRRGLVLTAFFGGLSSSTAVTVAYARRSRALDSHHRLFGAGIALAAATMVPRLSVEIAAVNPSLLSTLGPTLIVLALVPLAGLGWVAFLKPESEVSAQIKLSNPLQLSAALGFGLLLSLFFIAAQALQSGLGDAGIYAMAAVAGLVDVDAIGLSLAQAAGRTVPEVTAE
ncbi:MAG TPA: DUF4010 domain-containing protein, partial [Gammaproteobacteria bacterium]|nr:DUF4010 domain-containing protein [Gammaproteobacteria bacterium]